MYKISQQFVLKTIQTARDISVTSLLRDSLPSERERESSPQKSEAGCWQLWRAIMTVRVVHSTFFLPLHFKTFKMVMYIPLEVVFQHISSLKLNYLNSFILTITIATTTISLFIIHSVNTWIGILNYIKVLNILQLKYSN